jgi:hypothetical protein
MTAELMRSQTQRAILTTGMGEKVEVLQKLQLEFSSHRNDLTRLSFQIRLMERHPLLVEKVKAAVSAQPFLYALKALWGEVTSINDSTISHAK